MENSSTLWQKVSAPFDNVIKSMNNLNEGYSLKKEMAVVMIFVGVVSPIRAWMSWAIAHNDFSLLPTILTISTGFIAILMGINAVANNNNKDGNTDGKAK